MERAERRALYPGSFDPPTDGHKWVMEQVSHGFDKGIVAIGRNPEKSGRFSVDQREMMLREIADDFPNLTVTSFLGMYQADFAQMIGADWIVRGVRNANDFAYESDAIHVNKNINSDLLTVSYVPPKELLQVSSSMVMSLVGFEGWENEVKKLVPESVFTRIKEQHDNLDREKLERRWWNLTQRLGAKDDIQGTFDSLYQSYTEPHRAYHTISHIKMCLNEFDLIRNLLEDPDSVELAIWYHDAIYNSENQTSHDDEGDSANLAEKQLNDLLISPSLIVKASELILATKHTELTSNRDAQILLDIDLAILGRSSRLFDIYDENIRKEYSWVPQDRYAAERTRILKSFLDRDSIFQSEFFRSRYEEQAKKNLRRAISRLLL